MKILFLVLDIHYLRNYESVIRTLADQGHEIFLGPQRSDERAGPEIKALVTSLLSHGERISMIQMPDDRASMAYLCQQLRLLRDFARYQEPFYAGAEKCAARVGTMLHPWLRWLDGRPEAARLWNRRLQRLEPAIPVDPRIKAAIAELAPDLLFVSPLIDLGGSQTDFVKAARALRIPTVLGVASWDNLTNKGLIKLQTDRVLVWNEAQKREAVELHEVPEARIAVTGAQLFDDWFGMQPSLTREAFCAKVGLDATAPYFLYTASSLFINRNEVEFVARWIAALRRSDDPRLGRAGVLIRPHPKSIGIAKQWQDPSLAGAENLAVFPPGGRMPISAEDKADYFHSLCHCAGVVGINTSAMLEAGIVGRRCFTIRLPELAQSQDGMVHFAHLVEHGFIQVSNSFDEHFEQLRQELDRDGSSESGPNVRAFLRPQGLDQPATPLAVRAIEEAAQAVPEPQATTLFTRLIRPLITLAGILAPLCLVILPLAIRDSVKRIAKFGRWSRRRTARVFRRGGRRVRWSLRRIYKGARAVFVFIRSRALFVLRRGRQFLAQQLHRQESVEDGSSGERSRVSRDHAS